MVQSRIREGGCGGGAVLGTLEAAAEADNLQLDNWTIWCRQFAIGQLDNLVQTICNLQFGAPFEQQKRVTLHKEGD